MPAPLIIAAAQPRCIDFDVEANAREHAVAVREAQARVVVFPELSLTGYQLSADTVDPDGPALAPIVEACASTGALALVGAPVADADGQEFIAVLRVDGDGARVAYRKSWLSEGEAQRFSAGDGPTVLEVDGWRLGLAVCKDTGVTQHTSGTAALGIDAYVAGLVQQPDELAEHEARAVAIARACRAYVVFASAAGPTGEGYAQTAGGSAIWAPDGLAILRAGQDPGEVIRTVLG